MNDAPYQSKITEQHRRLKAIVYLRQSSPKQVDQNLESQRLQYAMTDRAKALGFRQVETIDCDLGKSASLGADARHGFDSIIAKKPHGNFQGEVIGDCRERSEGIRIKHRMKANSLKMYNKHANLLRVEMTMNDPSDFKAFRPGAWDPDGPRAWRPLRKGIADLHRRARVSQGSNERYLDALASLDTDAPLHELIAPVCRPVRWKGRRVRPLRSWSKEDGTLFRAISRGEFALGGFRNRDLVAHLFDGGCDRPEQRRRTSGRVTRKLRLLRAHGIIRKVSRTHRYMLTKKGREIATAILDSQDVTLAQLKKAAA